jgi:hypothetical protein
MLITTKVINFFSEIFCSNLIIIYSHWRKNKSLRFILRAKNQLEIKANTRVVILAGNDYNPCATLKNNISWFRGNQAEFNDLRFLGASGRGLKIKIFLFENRRFFFR